MADRLTDSATITWDESTPDQIKGNVVGDPASFLQAGTGAVWRTALSKMREVFSVTDFGAVGDNATDDSAEFQACFTAAIAAGKAVRIPAGTYFLGNTGLTWTNAPCAIVGDGHAVTVLRWNGSAGGIAISQNNDDYFTRVADLSLWQSGSAVGTAILYDGSAQKAPTVLTDRTSPRFKFDNLSIRGTTNPATNGWNKHIDVNNGINGLFDGIWIQGKFTTTQDNIDSASGIHLRGDGSPVEFVISNSTAFYVDDAVLVGDCEGVFIDNCNFVAIGRGVTFNPAAGEPQLCVANSHISAFVNCIKASNLLQGQIMNNLLYSRNDAVSGVTMILFEDNCDDCHISNNTFNKTSSQADTGVNIGGTTGSLGNRILNNIFLNVDTGISVAAGATNTWISGNLYRNVATQLVNNGVATRRFADNDGTSSWSVATDDDAGTTSLRVHNTSDGAVLTKLAAYQLYGTDTIGTVKEVARIEAVPPNANWTASTLRLYSRLADAMVESLRLDGTAVTLFAGTTARAPLNLTAGANLTAAAAGAVEYDGKVIYGTAVAGSRQAVNMEQVTTLTADRAGADVATAQNIFAGTEDVLSLAASTTYEFEALYSVTRAVGTTSHTIASLFGGTATFTSIDYLAQVTNPTGNALANVQQIMGNAAAAVTLTAPNIVGTESVIVKLRGTMRINAAGTIIPQLQYSAAPGGAPTFKRNSFFRCWPIGSDAVAAVGNWA